MYKIYVVKQTHAILENGKRRLKSNWRLKEGLNPEMPRNAIRFKLEKLGFFERPIGSAKLRRDILVRPENSQRLCRVLFVLSH